MGEEVTDDEELAALNAGGGDDAELAKLNGATKAEPAPVALKEEPSFWSKAANTLGLGNPKKEHDTVASNLMAAQNGATAGLAPKINAVGQYALSHPLDALRSVGHGIAPETVDAAPEKPWDDILAKNQKAYGAASEEHPVTDFVGSLALPVPKGVGVLDKATKMGGASVLQSAARQYGQSPESEPAKAIDPKQLAISGGLGLALGGLAGGADKLAQRGEEKSANAIARNSGQIDAEAESANRSAGRGVAEQKNAIFTTLANARAAASDATLPWEERLANEKWLASPEARQLAQNASELNRTRAGGLQSALERASGERDEVASKYAPEMLEKLKQESLAKPQLMPRLADYAKKSIPTAVGLGLGHLLGHDAVGAVAGSATGMLMGKPQIAFRNMMRSPQFQNTLGEAMQTAGRGVSGALSTPATPRAASSLAEYLDQLNKKEP